FDVINDVDVDGYLMSVVPREMFPQWPLEAYKAQAIVARTYALYVARTAPMGTNFDLFADTRSQVYGGIHDESAKSRSGGFHAWHGRRLWSSWAGTHLQSLLQPLLRRRHPISKRRL